MKHIKVTHRKRCRICGGANLKKWVHLPGMPLTDDMRMLDDLGEEFTYDIDVFRCLDCDVSQLLHNVDFEKYYSDYNYTVCKSKLANKFMLSLAEAVFKQYNLPKDFKVVEIGSGDGTQLNYFKKMGAIVFGFEPSKKLYSISKSKGLQVYNGLFTKDTSIYIPKELIPVDVLLLTYTFDHISEPMAFLDIAKIILNDKTGLLIIEVHDLDEIIKLREYCLFEHEHTIYLTLETMQRVLNRAGFTMISSKLLPKEKRRGNSLLIVATINRYLDKNQLNYKSFPMKLNNETKKMYENFNDEIKKGIGRLDKFVKKQLSLGNRIAGYGAGGRGVMTLASMETSSMFEYICDKNRNFYGRMTPKSHVPTRPLKSIKTNPVNTLIVFSYGYIEEIREDVQQILKKPLNIISLLDIL